MKALTKTDYNFPGQQSVYHGKVRDVYNINDEKLVMVATDRISAFDVVLPEGIPYKGQILNQIAAKFLDVTTDICPNWKLATPDPMVTVGVFCEGFPLEMIVTGDMTQIDLPSSQVSGLVQAMKILKGVKGIAFIELNQKDIVRHKLVTKIVEAYDKYEKEQKAERERKKKEETIAKTTRYESIN